MYPTLNSKATHINPVTGKSVPDESISFFDSYLEEDENNYYIVRAWHTDGEDKKVYPKSEWVSDSELMGNE